MRRNDSDVMKINTEEMNRVRRLKKRTVDEIYSDMSEQLEKEVLDCISGVTMNLRPQSSIKFCYFILVFMILKLMNSFNRTQIPDTGHEQYLNWSETIGSIK